MDTDQLKQHEAETLEVLLASNAGTGPEEVSRAMAAMRGEGANSYVSSEHRLALRKLAKDRASGKYSKDIDGFKEAAESIFAEINANADSGND